RISETDDGVQGRTKLVAHTREKATLRFAGRLQRAVCRDKVLVEGGLLCVQGAHALCHSIDVGAEGAELIAVNDLDSMMKIAGGHAGHAAIDPAHWLDDGP